MEGVIFDLLSTLIKNRKESSHEGHKRYLQTIFEYL